MPRQRYQATACKWRVSTVPSVCWICQKYMRFATQARFKSLPRSSRVGYFGNSSTHSFNLFLTRVERESSFDGLLLQQGTKRDWRYRALDSNGKRKNEYCYKGCIQSCSKYAYHNRDHHAISCFFVDREHMLCAGVFFSRSDRYVAKTGFYNRATCLNDTKPPGKLMAFYKKSPCFQTIDPVLERTVWDPPRNLLSFSSELYSLFVFPHSHRKYAKTAHLGRKYSSVRSKTDYSVHSKQFSTTSFGKQHQHAMVKECLVGMGPIRGPIRRSKGNESSIPIRQKLKEWQENHTSQEAVELDQAHEHLARDVVDAQNRGLPPAFAVRSQEDRLVYSSRTEQSNDPQDQNYSIDSSEAFPGSYFVSPGDVIEVIRNGQCRLAMVVRRMERQIQLYTMDGDWAHTEEARSCFVLHRFFRQCDVDLIKPYLPESQVPDSMASRVHSMIREVPRDISSHLIDCMRKFASDANDAYRVHARAIDSVHGTVAFQKNTRYISLMEIACEILNIGKGSMVPEATLWAIHRHLMLEEHGFMHSEYVHWRYGVWEVTPLEEMNRMMKVQSWVREHQEQAIISQRRMPLFSKYGSQLSGHKIEIRTVISRFVERAQKIVTENRKTRQLTRMGEVGSDTNVRAENITRCVTLHKFTESDLTIIRFFSYWAVRSRTHPQNPFRTLGPTILRATGLYEDYRLWPYLSYTFLVELGIFPPWYNRQFSNSWAPLPSFEADSELNRMQLESAESASSFTEEDSMADLRKDWSSSSVFCIDSIDAKEIDDGISLEEIPHDPNSYWVHVHVANPTAFIEPHHPIARYARELYETAYFPEGTYHMLPEQFGRDRFSLDRDRPVLTISTKITDKGDIKDYKITVGTIHNVFFLTYHTLHEILHPGLETRPSNLQFSIGSISKPDEDASCRKLSTDLDSSQRRLLIKLGELARARRCKLDAEGALMRPMMIREVSVSWKDSLSPSYEEARRFEGDPSISITTQPWDPDTFLGTSEHHAAVDTVRTLMMLACESAGKWCKTRNIPTFYRGTVDNPENSQASRYLREQVFSQLTKENRKVSWTALENYQRKAPKPTLSSEPLSYPSLAMEAYVKVTSPLRRYVDMVAHWQIQAALRQEAQLERSLAGSEDSSYLPHSVIEVKAMVRKFELLETVKFDVSRKSFLHWFFQLLIRAHYFKEVPSFPHRFTFVVASLSQKGFGVPLCVKVRVVELSIYGLASDNDVARAHGGLKVGDVWEAEIADILAFNRLIWMTPLRLIARGR